MKKYLITLVLVCLFLVGCSSEDGSHNHDHDHGLLHDHNLVLEEEVGSNKTLEERSKLVKVGMTIEEVKFVMGFPDEINITTKIPLTFYYYFPITNEDQVEGGELKRPSGGKVKRTRRRFLRLRFVNFGGEILLRIKPEKGSNFVLGHLEVSE